ncbi:MAG: hypothetical protein HDR21_00275 [Lachnospiraceae bacterium]|nr:hypothetical protein [Lachnospiraceae bacterium]
MYEQKICYIDLYRNGVKCGNMGHVRMEWDENRYRFGVNLCHMDRQTLVTAVLERTGGRPRTTIQNIAIIHGKGSASFDWMPLEGNEESLLFQASGEVYGICRLPKMRETPKQEDTETAEQTEAVRPMSMEQAVLQLTEGSVQDIASGTTERTDGKPKADTGTTQRQGGKSKADAGTTQRQDGKPKADAGTMQRQDGMPGVDSGMAEEPETAVRMTEQQSERAEENAQEERKPEVKKNKEPEAGRGKKTVVLTYPQNAEARRQHERHVTALSDDKWKQLCSIYPTVHPIGDDVDFIKITPVDFVVLRQEYQNLVRNSFLLHGYYNYNYILLGKYPDKYYIGVPGIMHEQERIAAAMFGFVGFERAEAPKEQKENRDRFGYYMMEVGI